ncbi:cobyrinic acid a,c-diamide synthase [Enhydrobacter aerosaccus]|uniref:Hydrogenobyrinate a,c-diamide synthase n=1 Tax=Enhydrobacter aerosaccus TaxID=225324 RepID=A0A1T4NX68_9HYPH|nr:cobyrinate a,c-diamide synthase [Enhydrobacter aerosaccus]SJZ83884.1 cobyrinic acid a,c-diamide synthase [Enhydrobacter aerosaccus]
MTQCGLVIAGTRSGSGKTTIALGLMRGLARRGRRVQGFKCGPDYIDPAFHAVATGRPSFNLDAWAMAPGQLIDLVVRHPADIAVAEGVMGLFDGVRGRGATADVAALLRWPVVLVLDVKGQTETAAALVAGCMHYRDDVEIAGVILNRVASPRHLALIQPALERIGVKLFGAVLQDKSLVLPERHLGLVQAGETAHVEHRLDALADVLAESVDLTALEYSARPATLRPSPFASLPPPGQRIAVAQDAAFSFLYPHLLEQWRDAGAEVMPFSPLRDEAPAADADAVWLPGGYPELHAGVLAQAERFLKGLRGAAARGVPVHGECGGYMVLGDGLVDAEGVRHAMAGLLQLETSFAQRRLHLGYRLARLQADCLLGKKGSEIVGHEFHYASILSIGDDPVVDCRDADDLPVTESGARRGSVTGTFFHAIGVGSP